MNFKELTDTISKAGIESLSFWYSSFMFWLAIKLIAYSLFLYIFISLFKLSIEMRYIGFLFGVRSRLRRGYNRVQDLLKRNIIWNKKRSRGRQKDLSHR